MILVDTSVWVDHLRQGNRRLTALLDAGVVSMHPFVVGEIALGHLGPRDETLAMLLRLPQVAVATPDEVLQLIERHRLFGVGIGYVDAHLLAAARLMGGMPLWTTDRRMRDAAQKLGLPPVL